MRERQFTQQFESLFEVIAILNRLNDFDEILRLLTERITVLFKADAAFIMMLNPDTHQTIKTAMRSGSPTDFSGIVER